MAAVAAESQPRREAAPLAHPRGTLHLSRHALRPLSAPFVPFSAIANLLPIRATKI
jgi:hypothetical protein